MNNPVSKPIFGDKPLLCVDWDGVIHSYSSGWQGADVVSDPPTPGALDWLREATDHFEVCIYSSRSSQPGGIAAMKEALIGWIDEAAAFDSYSAPPAWYGKLQWPTSKPAAFLTIDDRALRFTGDWARFDPKTLLAFKPWNK